MAHRRQSSSRPPASGNRARNSRGEASRHRDGDKRERRRSRSQRPGTTSSDENAGTGSAALSTDALAQLERENARRKRDDARKHRKAERTRKAAAAGSGSGGDYTEVAQETRADRHREDRHRDREARRAAKARGAGAPDAGRGKDDRRKKRVVSGALMEEGRSSGLRGGRGEEWRWSDQSFEKPEMYHKSDKRRRNEEKKKKKKKKRLWIMIGAGALVLLIIIIAVAVVVSKKKSKGDSDSGLDGKDRDSIPKKWRNTYLDPWTWETTDDFNTTFTDEMVGDLPVMGLMTDWDDSKRANDKVPALNEKWGAYSSKPARGMNLGGWLSPEPFITPSLFPDGLVDEYGLCNKLGSSAASTLEKHYATFVTEDDFKQIASMGLDHVRIPFSYWAVVTYDGDPYIFRTSWRYLLRGIEWARKYGLRVNLDMHALPGSQNGYNHSGRKGTIGWLNGTDGSLNGQRSLDIHDRLSKFFTQPRYRNIISHYGLANEPRMVELDADDVVAWTEKAYSVVKGNGYDGLVVFGDGFMGLNNWQGRMTGYDDLVLDVHQYVIFNDDLISFTHKRKVQYACTGWTEQTELSLNTSQGYGPSMFAEWSQADTDCEDLVNGGVSGSRWEGTLAEDSSGPQCPAADDSCSCAQANADPSSYSDAYKKFLKMFAEAQMHSFEIGWGWWYWTWKTESAPLWSWKAGVAAGVLPEKAYERDFDCDSTIPDFGDEGLSENY